MIFHAIWLILISCVLCIKCEGHEGSLALDKEYLQLAWRTNSTKGTIRFTVKAKIDENGWFLIGFSSQKNVTKKMSFQDVTGDAFVVWKGTSKNNAKSVWRISECSIKKGTLQKDQDHKAHYHLGSSSYNKTTQILTAIVWRPLKSKNSNDVEIKHGPLVVFGSYGNDDGSKIMKWKQKMKKLNNGAVDDAFKETENVDFFKSTSKTKGKSNKGMGYAVNIAEKHWLGVVVGVSAFLTIIITCLVYCVTKKTRKEFKNVVSMPFHKNTDYDDEAKVAFLQSEET